MRAKSASLLFSICFLGSAAIAACSSSSDGGGDSGSHECSDDSDCPGNDVCDGGECVGPDNTSGGGASGSTGSGSGESSSGSGGAPSGPCSQCPKGCFYLEDDPNNCGSCGYVCPVSVSGAKAVCVAGQCQEECTTSNESICNGSCLDLSSDPSNCGQCNHYCDEPSGGSASCVGGACKNSCPSGKTVCSSACVDLGSDEYNCGSCNTSCANLPPPEGSNGYTCQGGQCVASCPAGTSLCGNACVSLQEDNLNCGSCGYVCGGNYACDFGSCSTNSCAYDTCPVEQFMSECCGATESCNYYWGTDINGNPEKHYYCG